MGSPDPLISFRRVPECAGLHREELEAFAQSLRASVAGGREFHCRITGDVELRQLNRDYLGKDYATDVLSFPANRGDGFLGDLAISRLRAKAQARAFGHSLTQELQLLLLHGVLHLMGFDHERDGGAMEHAERRWQTKFKLPNSVIRRAGQPELRSA